MWRLPFRRLALEVPEPSVAALPPSSGADRLALFAVALAKDKAPRLLELLASPERERALEAVQRLASQSSSERQAALAIEFGEAPFASERVRAIWAEAGPLLAAEIARRLPAHHRQVLRLEAPPPQSPGLPPLLIALAERLAREATR